MSELSLAIYKAETYGNYEDLDVEEDYSDYGIYKGSPEFLIYSNKDRDIVSPEGFVRHMTQGTVLDDLDIDDVESDGNGVFFTCRQSWNWYTDSQDPFDGDDFWDGLHQYMTDDVINMD